MEITKKERGEGRRRAEMRERGREAFFREFSESDSLHETKPSLHTPPPRGMFSQVLSLSFLCL
jgi:hypothetical protein